MNEKRCANCKHGKIPQCEISIFVTCGNTDSNYFNKPVYLGSTCDKWAELLEGGAE